jgi:structural maintenance of chromosome 1
MGRILRLEVENFKSYGGQHAIPFHEKFNAVIGSNGSGKSNVMKAISFVLGIRSAELGSDKLRDLIFRPDQGRPAQRLAARVTLVYLVDEADEDVKDAEPGEELFFTRCISPSGTGSYKLSVGEGNERDVTWEEYEEQMNQIKINVHCRKTFLVFQVRACVRERERERERERRRRASAARARASAACAAACAAAYAAAQAATA